MLTPDEVEAAKAIHARNLAVMAARRAEDENIREHTWYARGGVGPYPGRARPMPASAKPEADEVERLVAEIRQSAPHLFGRTR